MIEMNQPSMPLIERLQQRSLQIGGAVLALSLIGIFFSPAQFFRSYLFAYVFWAGLTLGCLAVTLLHHLSGGRWGAVVRRFLESSTKTFPLLALMFLPILAGMHSLYEWTDQNKI